MPSIITELQKKLLGVSKERKNRAAARAELRSKAGAWMERGTEVHGSQIKDDFLLCGIYVVAF